MWVSGSTTTTTNLSLVINIYILMIFQKMILFMLLHFLFCSIDINIHFEHVLVEVLISSFAVGLKLYTFHEMH